jgi:hypothetical protein
MLQLVFPSAEVGKTPCNMVQCVVGCFDGLVAICNNQCVPMLGSRRRGFKVLSSAVRRSADGDDKQRTGVGKQERLNWFVAP